MVSSIGEVRCMLLGASEKVSSGGFSSCFLEARFSKIVERGLALLSLPAVLAFPKDERSLKIPNLSKKITASKEKNVKNRANLLQSKRV